MYRFLAQKSFRLKQYQILNTLQRSFFGKDKLSSLNSKLYKIGDP